MPKTLDTHQRALAVNLDPTCYGTFAEIGAGQEVARWFMKVGGAAGTIAKTISAYDMAFSDAIYGAAGRYVSRERLRAMLAHEFPLLAARLGRARARGTRFFAFANTVAARNYAGTNECHGWVGLRFQHRPLARPSELLLHVNLRDGTNLQQQEALGVLGVNLVHAAFFGPGRGARRVGVLLDGLAADRIEVDFAELSGPAFTRVDGRDLALELVHAGLARAVAFDERGACVPPTELLRKRALVFERGGPRSRGLDLARSGRELVRQQGTLAREPLLVTEFSAGPRSAAPALRRRLAEQARARRAVLVTAFGPGLELVRYLRRYTRAPLVQALDVTRFLGALCACGEGTGAGGAFEALGQRLGLGVETHVHPQARAELVRSLRGVGLAPGALPQDAFVTAGDPVLVPALEALRAHLLLAGEVVALAPELLRARRSGPSRAKA